MTTTPWYCRNHSFLVDDNCCQRALEEWQQKQKQKEKQKEKQKQQQEEMLQIDASHNLWPISVHQINTGIMAASRSSTPSIFKIHNQEIQKVQLMGFIYQASKKTSKDISIYIGDFVNSQGYIEIIWYTNDDNKEYKPPSSSSKSVLESLSVSDPVYIIGEFDYLESRNELILQGNHIELLPDDKQIKYHRLEVAFVCSLITCSKEQQTKFMQHYS